MMRIVNLAILCLTLATAFALYQVKYATQAEDRHIRALKAELAEERDAIQVLRAEWSLLNQPDRLAALAERYTRLQPMAPAQVATMADLPGRPPALPGLEPGGALGGFAGSVAGPDIR